MRPLRKFWIAILAAGLLGTPVPSLALADADPASDTLVGASVFYPYTSQVSSQLQKALNAETAAASRAHFPIKVALIAAPLDLGGLPSLFGKTEQYAKFLDREITFNKAPPLLVVMPAGFGVAGLTSAASTAATSLVPPSGKTGDDLAQAALAAIPKLAAASGRQIGTVTVSSGGGKSSGSTVPIIAIVAVVAAATAAAIIALRRRQSRRR